jgi:hypothetical protein
LKEFKYTWSGSKDALSIVQAGKLQVAAGFWAWSEYESGARENKTNTTQINNIK